MARGASEDSGASSFFFMFGRASHLDMQYGIFGSVLMRDHEQVS